MGHLVQRAAVQPFERLTAFGIMVDQLRVPGNPINITATVALKGGSYRHVVSDFAWGGGK